MVKEKRVFWGGQLWRQIMRWRLVWASHQSEYYIKKLVIIRNAGKTVKISYQIEASLGLVRLTQLILVDKLASKKAFFCFSINLKSENARFF